MPRAIPQRRAEGSIVFPKSSQGDPSTFYPITTTTSHTLEPKQTDSYLIEYLIAILNTIATLLVFGAHTRDVHTLSWIVLLSFNLLHERDQPSRRKVKAHGSKLCCGFEKHVSLTLLPSQLPYK